jgi:phosphoenolpyruvate-protein kinase (PTS system EI component)
LPAVRSAIRQVSAADCRSLAERALEAESAVEVRAFASELLNRSVEGEAQ